MSKAVRFGVIGLGILVVFCAAVAVWALMQRQTLQGQTFNLHSQIADAQNRLTDASTKAKDLQDQIDQLTTKLTQSQQDKTQIQSQYDDLKNKSDDMQHQIDQANSERDDFKSRYDQIQTERDDLVQKLREKPKVVYRTKIVHDQSPDSFAAAPAAAVLPMPSSDSGVTSSSPSASQDAYWAAVLKQKAALQVELQKEKVELDQAALQVVGLKKKNSDLETEIKQVSNEKDEIVQRIKYGQDLADNLSIDLARARNDQEMVNDRADKVKDQNLELLSEIRDLNSAKYALERTVSRLTDEKDAMERKLMETQSVIQSRIDDIWKIKAGLDKKLSENQPSSSTPGSMELPPIIVNAPNNGHVQQAGAAPMQSAAAPAISNGKTEGTIISINESNNFVISDLGQDNSSISVGTPLKVYRDKEPIASLEVIQVRKDICAADIKDKSIELKVGDVVRFQ